MCFPWIIAFILCRFSILGSQNDTLCQFYGFYVSIAWIFHLYILPVSSVMLRWYSICVQRAHNLKVWCELCCRHLLHIKFIHFTGEITM
jgi:hypothetical protein